MTTESQIVEPVIRALAEVPGGRLSTTDLRERVKESINLTASDLEPLANRNDCRIDQTIRNLKSHKKSVGNPFFEGLLEDVPRGFKLTKFGRKSLE